MRELDEELQRLLAERLGGRVVLLVIPPEPAPACDGACLTGRTGAFEGDLTIEEYRTRYAPNLSPSTVAGWCRDGEFPDTTDEAGVIVPGAYATARGWCITMPGVQERQRRARQKGLDERRAGARMEPDAEESPKAPDSPATNGNDAARPAGIVKRGKAKQSTDVRPRAREGAWRDVKKAS